MESIGGRDVGSRARVGWNPDKLREYRETHSLTLEAAGEALRDAARAAGIKVPAANFQTLWQHEQGESYPTPDYRRAYCVLYQASEPELGFRNALPGEETTLKVTPTNEPSGMRTIAVERALLSIAPGSSEVDFQGLQQRILDAWKRRHIGGDPNRPSLVMVGGYAGSGKSEFARFLSELTGWPLLDKDTVTRPLVERLLKSLGCDPNDRHTETYKNEVRPLEYDCLMGTALANVRRALPIYATQRISVGAQQQQLLDTIGGAKTVRAFRLADEHIEKVAQRSGEAVRLSLRGVRLMTGFFARLNLAEFVGLAAVLGTGFLLVNAELATIGTATAAALYFHSLFNPINIALALVDDAQSATASLARLVGVADLPEARNPRSPPAPLDSSVKAADITHAYVSGYPVLREVDLHIGPSDLAAIGYIAHPENSASRHRLEEGFGRLGITPPTPVGVADWDTAILLAELGVGHAILPALPRLVNPAESRTIPIPDLPPLTVGWAVRQWAGLSPLATEFADLVTGRPRETDSA